MLDVILAGLLWPWKRALRHQVRKTLAAAEAAAQPGQVPAMKVVGEPPVRVVGEPTPTQVADFVRHRSPVYVEPMSDGVATALARMLLNADRPKPFGPAQMNAMMVGSPMAYLAAREGDWWVFDFRKRALYPTRKITIAGYRFHAETGAVEITDAWGKVHTQTDPSFATALTHTMCWWNHYIHSGLHNWVHFQLPDCMLEAHASLGDPDGVLARLLAPHLRFTARINYAGLWLNDSTDNGPSLRKRLKPWAAASSAAETFRRGVIENTQVNYAVLAHHFARPERLDPRVPYHAFIGAWFPVIEAFVARVDPFIDDADWEQLVRVLERGMPAIRTIERVRLLAAFIWQVAVLHTSDHLSYVGKAYDHGFHRVPETLDEPFTLADVGRFDRFKTRNFLKVFVDYNGTLDARNGLLDVDNYGFVEPELATAATAFRAQLLQVDAELEAAGTRLLRVDELLQSVCF